MSRLLQLLRPAGARRYHPHDLAPYLTRASAAWYFDPATGLLTQAASNVARICMSPAGVLSILREPQSTNLALRSNEFSTAPWGISNGTVTVGRDGPGGAGTAWKLASDNGVITNGLNQAIAKAASAITYTNSVAAKASGYGWLKLTLFDGGAQILDSWFNLNTGVVGSITNSGGFTAVSTAISAITGFPGWYWCSLTGTSPATTAINPYMYPVNADLAATNGNANGDGIDIWHNQVEAQAGRTSPIPTAGSTVTRSRDEIVIPTVLAAGQAFSEYIDCVIPWRDGDVRFISSGLNTNDVFNTGSNVPGSYNGTAVLVVGNSYSFNARMKLGQAANASGRSLCLNADSVATDGNTFPAITQRMLGQFNASADVAAPVLYIHEYRQARRRWSDSELKGYTT